MMDQNHTKVDPAPDLTEDQVHTLKHTLGLNDKAYEWRNRYFCEPSDPVITSLVGLGLMAAGFADHVFYVTDAGKAAAWAAMPPMKAYICTHEHHEGCSIQHALTPSKARHKAKMVIDEIFNDPAEYKDIKVRRLPEMDRRDPAEWCAEHAGDVG